MAPDVDVVERPVPGFLDRFIEGIRPPAHPFVARVDAGVWKVRANLPDDVGTDELEDCVQVHFPFGKQLEQAAKKLHVLVRNSRSPRRLRHGFQRNAGPQAFELAHESFRDALAVFAS